MTKSSLASHASIEPTTPSPSLTLVKLEIYSCSQLINMPMQWNGNTRLNLTMMGHDGAWSDMVKFVEVDADAVMSHVHVMCHCIEVQVELNKLRLSL